MGDPGHGQRRAPRLGGAPGLQARGGIAACCRRRVNLASCHLLNRPPLNRPPHVDIRKKSTPEPRVAVAGKNCKVPYMYTASILVWGGRARGRYAVMKEAARTRRR